MRALLGPSLVAALLLAIGSCTTAPPIDEEPPPGGEGIPLPGGGVFTRALFLEAEGACIMRHQSAFEVEAAALAVATASAAAGTATREAAQAAWADAIDAWQQLEVMQVGPAGPGVLAGGEALRDHIYGWPLINRCRIDTLLADDAFGQAALAAAPINVRGLAAVEYLLFGASDAHHCLATDALETSGRWAALSAEQRSARRAAYAASASALIAARATELVRAWDPAGGDFLGELTGAGTDSRTYRRQQLAINALSDALFYVEHGTKDLKVGRVAGITGCPTATCLDAVESPLARRSVAHLRNNLLGFRALFTGCDEGAAGLGFDDHLYAIGAPEVGAEIDAAVLGALAALDALEEPDLAEAVRADRASVEALYAAIKAITDVLRTRFISLLDLELPTQVEGDND